MKTASSNIKSVYTHTQSTYNPELDKFRGQILFKEKFEQAQESFSNIIIPKDILDKLNKVSISGFEMALKAAINYNTLRVNGFTIRKSIDVLIGTYCHETGCRLLHNDRDFNHFSECIKINFLKIA